MYTYNGIDRMDNAIGYTPNNVVTCCINSNIAKGNMKYHLFIIWIGKITGNLVSIKKLCHLN